MMTDPTTARALAELDDLLRERDALAEQVIRLAADIEQAAESDAFKDLLRSAIKAGYAIGYQAAIDEMKGRQL